MTSSSQDLKQKLAAAALEPGGLETERFYIQKILDTYSDGWWEWNLNNREELYISPHFKRLFGYEDHEVPNTLTACQKIIYPDDLALAMGAIEKHLASDGAHPYRCEVRYFHKNGQIIWVACRGAATRDEQGLLTRMVGVHTDITARKNLEIEKGHLQEEINLRILAEAEKVKARAATEQYQAESANRAKSQFLANMSHEIRTPLTIIHGYSELLSRDVEINPRNKLWIDKILQSTEQLSLLINDILDISKIEAGKIEVHTEAVELLQLVAEVKEFFSMKVGKRGLLLHFSWEGQLPAIIKTDHMRLKQILFNVIGNAIKFTNQGSVSVMVSLKPAVNRPSGEVLAFTVSDTGIGMTPEEKDKIFGAFIQADSSITRRFGGTGLGLSIAKSLAQLLGGDIVLSKSEPNVGSSFTITIDPGPMSATSLRLNSLDFEGKASWIKASPPSGGRLKGLKILLVDDAEDVRALITHMLGMQGALVSEAVNGKQGVELVRRSAFDCILMDIQMPVLDGFKAIHQLRLEGCIVPVLALSAHAMKGDRERCMAKGFTDHLAKPVRIDQLIQLILAVSSRNPSKLKARDG